jgi:aspartokinase
LEIVLEFLELKNSAISTESTLSQTVREILRTPKNFLVAVVPAMAGTHKNLQKAGEKALQQNLIAASSLAESSRTFHMQLAQQMTSQSSWMETKILLSNLFEELLDLLKGFYLVGELTPQGQTMLLSCAERASATITAQVLKEKGASSEALCHREIFLLNEQANSQKIVTSSLENYQQEISKLLENKIIPVIPALAFKLIAQGD